MSAQPQCTIHNSKHAKLIADTNYARCDVVQGQNSRLLPVNSAASLSSIVTSIYDAVPGGATYSPPSSVSLGVCAEGPPSLHG